MTTLGWVGLEHRPGHVDWCRKHENFKSRRISHHYGSGNSIECMSADRDITWEILQKIMPA